MRTEEIRPVSDEFVRLIEPGHVYLVGEGLTEREAPSLSRVLGASGYQTDYSTVDPAHLAWRSRVGTLTHEAIEAYLDDYDPQSVLNDADPFLGLHTQPHLDAFLGWASKHVLVPAYHEVPAYQPILGYACTADFVGWLDGEFWVIDWKTTSKISKTVALQTAGQAKCFDHRGAIAPFMRGALHLTKKGTAKLHRFPDDKLDFETLEAIAIANRNRGRYVQ